METLVDNQEKQTQMASKPGSGIGFTISLILFIVVLVGSIGLKVYVGILQNDIDTLKEEKTKVETTIATVNSNPLVAAYKLYSASKTSIDLEIQQSEAHRYLARLYKISADSFRKLAFVGFGYADGKVTTSASAFGNGRDASENVIEFIKNYREESLKNTDDTYLLDPVLSVTGDSIKRDFEITFKVKPLKLTPVAPTKK